MSEIEVGKIAFVKLSGEPVFVLSKQQIWKPGTIVPVVTKRKGLFSRTELEAPQEPPASKLITTGFNCRRFVRSERTGNMYINDFFTPPELETEEEFRKKFEEEEARVMKQFAAQGGEIVVEGVPPSSKENLA